MGQKTHPKAFRLGVIETWNSKWFARKDYAALVREDVTIRRFIQRKLRDAGLASVDIERSPTAMTLTLATSRPGVVIGRGGQGAESLKKEIQQRLRINKKLAVKLNIQEIRQPDLEAQIVVNSMIEQVEKRLPFRRIMKATAEQVMRAGAEGVKVMMAGRLNGAEIARSEHLTRGKLPLQTLRANIQYSRGVATTTYGTIGVKVWIYKGEIFENAKPVEATTP